MRDSKSTADPAEYDVIMKPRTNFSCNVLRKVIPAFNVQDKIGTISMSKIKILSSMRLADAGVPHSPKIRTVASMPKIQSLDSGGASIMLQKSKESGQKGENETKKVSSKLFGIAEEGDNHSSSEESSGSSGSSGSSMGLDGEENDLDKLYEQLLSDQK